MAKILYALTLKQPWAALVVHGLKTVEVRRWPTRRRGLILIHAARTADDRPEGWAALTLAAARAVTLRGGVVGAAELVGSLTYDSRDSFAADRARHLNNPDWFLGPTLHGFELRNARPLPFRPLAGWVKFFPVEVGEESMFGVTCPGDLSIN
jgi:hypothetical protein